MIINQKMTHHYPPITLQNSIHVSNKHLHLPDSTPFLLRGIAFPTPPETYLPQTHGYNATSWLAILHQLRYELKLDFNTIRLYRMYPDKVNYTEFLEGAAEMGVYVIVPLTSAEGPGVLDRTKHAPKCYPRKLFKYGTRALDAYLQHPNVLAGMVGNEVMNDAKAWLAGPCIRAYARDLKLYMEQMVEDGKAKRTLPLMYATQDSSTIGSAEMTSDEAVKLTVDYLTCVEEGKGVIVPDVAGIVASNDPNNNNKDANDDLDEIVLPFSQDRFGQSPIDIFGINIESWCSSTQTFEYNFDGTQGSYYTLWKTLQNTSIPLIFSEMGCPHSHFDHDDKTRVTKEGTRTWSQIPVVLNEMSDSWAGFIAYAYDGPQDFVMFTGGPWNGKDVLTPTKDFDNFRKELKKYEKSVNPIAVKEDIVSDENEDVIAGAPFGAVGAMGGSGAAASAYLPRQCDQVEAELLSCCGIRLFNDDKMRSYAMENGHTMNRPAQWIVVFIFALIVGVFVTSRRMKRGGKWEKLPEVAGDRVYSNGSSNGYTNGMANGTNGNGRNSNYMSIQS